MPAYVIGDITVTDPERYKDYAARTQSTLQPFGGEFVVRGGPTEVLEGPWQPGRLVVIEFPSAQAAKDWYASDGYREIAAIRREASEGALVLVEGYSAGGTPPGP